MALSTAVRPKLYTPAERENGKAAWLLGLSFISEGAIPFAAADPLRVIPSMMLGGATTGAIVAGAGHRGARAARRDRSCSSRSATSWCGCSRSSIGTVVGAVAVTVAKSIGRTNAEDVPEDAVDLEHSHVPAHATQPADRLTGHAATPATVLRPARKRTRCPVRPSPWGPGWGCTPARPR